MYLQANSFVAEQIADKELEGKIVLW